jgi:predicted aspartyl protease
MTVEGRIDEELRIKVPVRVGGLRGVTELEAILDTGFNGALCLPASYRRHFGIGVDRFGHC